MNVSQEKERLVFADVIAKAWNDDQFKQKLIANPKQVLSNAGMEGITDNIEISVLENTAHCKYIVLPGLGKTEDISKGLHDYFKKIMPLPAGLKLTLVQNSDKLNHIVLPMRPPVAQVHLDASHAQISIATGWESVNVYTDAAGLVTVVIDNAVVVSSMLAQINSLVQATTQVLVYI